MSDYDGPTRSTNRGYDSSTRGRDIYASQGAIRALNDERLRLLAEIERLEAATIDRAALARLVAALELDNVWDIGPNGGEIAGALIQARAALAEAER